jgi:membrane-associated phospholipid phosphatase
MTQWVNRRAWRWTLVVAAAIAALGTRASAQSTFRTFGRDVANGVGDILFMWTSPFHSDRHDWALALAAGGATFAVGLADDPINDWLVEHPSSPIVRAAKPWREDEKVRLRDWGTARNLVPLSGGLYAIGIVTGSKKWREAGIGCLTAHEGNSLLRGLVYEAIARQRPDSAFGDPYQFDIPGGKWEKHSFFAGHAANAFACATFFSQRYHLGPIEPLLYGFAGGIALARVTDQRHWASDTVLGILIGYGMGYTVAKRMEDRDERAARATSSPEKVKADEKRLSLLMGGNQVGLQYKF